MCVCLGGEFISLFYSIDLNCTSLSILLDSVFDMRCVYITLQTALNGITFVHIHYPSLIVLMLL